MKKITYYFIPLAIFLIALYDLYAYLNGGQKATISYIIIEEWAHDYPAFTFAMGFVFGHLFWPLYREKK